MQTISLELHANCLIYIGADWPIQSIFFQNKAIRKFLSIKWSKL